MSSSSICRISSPATISRRLPPFTTMLAPARGAPSWLSCRLSSDSFTIKPPRHPTYDLMGIIKLALAEDAGVRGNGRCGIPCTYIGDQKNCSRMGLFDMVMIKDNHISIAGGVINALKAVELYLDQKNLQMEVEVETRTLEEVKELLHHASQTMGDLRPRISSY
ncbi:hypothetical protein L6164_026752 [Bauhinia variegata]|uniref:Uncharacterized protein n=1 Tax=Bauhinia variegata TaxID=167791 RepID=A0ACB9LR43_BAUVA|nr:hypothetical protein L6164_026752 [Bauhinia variegata]